MFVFICKIFVLLSNMFVFLMKMFVILSKTFAFIATISIISSQLLLNDEQSTRGIIRGIKN